MLRGKGWSTSWSPSWSPSWPPPSAVCPPAPWMGCRVCPCGRRQWRWHFLENAMNMDLPALSHSKLECRNNVREKVMRSALAEHVVTSAHWLGSMHQPSPPRSVQHSPPNRRSGLRTQHHTLLHPELKHTGYAFGRMTSSPDGLPVAVFLWQRANTCHVEWPTSVDWPVLKFV